MKSLGIKLETADEQTEGSKALCNHTSCVKKSRPNLLIMHPPLHMRATPPKLSFQPSSLAVSRISINPWAYETILDAYRACLMLSMKALRSPENLGASGPVISKQHFYKQSRYLEVGGNKKNIEITRV